jgi:hypothetical protein
MIAIKHKLFTIVLLQKLMLWHFYNHHKSICGYYEIQGEIVFSCGNQKTIHPMIKTCAFIILNQNLWVTTSKQHYDCIEIGLNTIYHEYFKIDIFHSVFFHNLNKWSASTFVNLHTHIACHKLQWSIWL